MFWLAVKHRYHGSWHLIAVEWQVNIISTFMTRGPGLASSSFQPPPQHMSPAPPQQPTFPNHSINPLTKSLSWFGLCANYRKLCIFSRSPTAPRDKDPFDSWVEWSTGQLQEWTASGLEEFERRRRISEALRPSASGIVRTSSKTNLIQLRRIILQHWRRLWDPQKAGSK